MQGRKWHGGHEAWWEVSTDDIQAMLAATDWAPANLGYFRGGGFSSHYRTRAEMPVTMIRVNILNGTQPLLQSQRAIQ